MFLRKLFLLLPNLSLFDDGDGTDGDATGNQEDPAGDLDPGSSHQDDNGEQPVIIYGKQDDADDKDDASGQKDTVDQNEVRKQKYQKFIEENKDLYDEDFKSKFQPVFDKRFKDYKEKTEKLQTYENKLLTLASFFDVNSIDELDAKFDTEILEELAAKKGMEPKEYKELLELKRYKSQKEAEEKLNEQEKQEREAEALREKLFKEETELKKTFPKFNLQDEYSKNSKFKNLLHSGWTVEEAYKACYPEEYAKVIAQKQKSNMVDSILAGKKRPSEVGTKPTPKVIVKTDPSKFTFEDIDRVVEEARKGKQIRF